MTNHAIAHHHAESHRNGSGFFATLRRNWQARQQVRRLLDFDERMLRDIGVTRDEVARVVKLPLKTNPALELEATSGRRRRAQRLAGDWS